MKIPGVPETGLFSVPQSAALIKANIRRIPFGKSSWLIFTEIGIGVTRRENRFDAYALPVYCEQHGEPVGQYSEQLHRDRAITGLEIKVSRADFLGDEKLEGYREWCNKLYIVAPPGIVRDTDELPAGVGYIEWAKRRRIIVQAEYRQIPAENFVFIYYALIRQLAFNYSGVIRKGGNYPPDRKIFYLQKRLAETEMLRQEVCRLSRLLKKDPIKDRLSKLEVMYERRMKLAASVLAADDSRHEEIRRLRWELVHAERELCKLKSASVEESV